MRGVLQWCTEDYEQDYQQFEAGYYEEDRGRRGGREVSPEVGEYVSEDEDAKRAGKKARKKHKKEKKDKKHKKDKRKRSSPGDGDGEPGESSLKHPSELHFHRDIGEQNLAPGCQYAALVMDALQVYTVSASNKKSLMPSFRGHSDVCVTEERDVHHQGSYGHDDRMEPHAPYQRQSPAAPPQSTPPQVCPISSMNNQVDLWTVLLAGNLWSLMNNQMSLDGRKRIA